VQRRVEHGLEHGSEAQGRDRLWQASCLLCLKEDQGEAALEPVVVVAGLPSRLADGVELRTQDPLQHRAWHLVHAPAQPDRHVIDGLVDRLACCQGLQGVLVEDLRGSPRRLQEDVFLTGEVEVEGGLGDPGPGRDLLGFRVVDAGGVAALGPQLQGGPDDGPPGVPGPLLGQP
jgi:hypothetical protein